VSARVGADDIAVFKSPRPQLLREITGLDPAPSGVHVPLEEHRVRSTQRLALSDIGGRIVVETWPAELKRQADYLYAGGRGRAMVTAARERGWQVEATAHIAFFNSAPAQRLYTYPDVDAATYTKRWEGADGRLIGQHSRDELRRRVWPWLKQRDYASAADDDVLDQFMAILGRRNAHLRPGMRFRRHWSRNEIEALGTRELAARVRADVNAILGAAGDPPLPVRNVL
jgi:hypothetical protein